MGSAAGPLEEEAQCFLGGGAGPGDVLRKSVRATLERLRTDSVALLYLAYRDSRTPLEDTLRVVDELHREGHFAEFGLSNLNAADVHARSRAGCCVRRGAPGRRAARGTSGRGLVRTGRFGQQPSAEPVRARPANVVDPAQLLEYPDQACRRVDLARQHAVARARGVGVM